MTRLGLSGLRHSAMRQKGSARGLQGSRTSEVWSVLPCGLISSDGL